MPAAFVRQFTRWRICRTYGAPRGSEPLSFTALGSHHAPVRLIQSFIRTDAWLRGWGLFPGEPVDDGKPRGAPSGNHRGEQRWDRGKGDTDFPVERDPQPVTEIGRAHV